MLNQRSLISHSALLILFGLFCRLLATTQTDQVAIQSQSAESSHCPLGISIDKPTGENFVTLRDGTYMVPYTATIPGTDVRFTMVPIPGGRFWLGTPPQEGANNLDENPPIEIEVEPFWMGQHEVTWAEYRVFQELEYMFRRLQVESKFLVEPSTEIDGVSGATLLYEPSVVYGYGESDDSPASMMTQFAAKQYTKMLSLLSDSFYRLPTEAEWEYACRAGSTTRWYFGNDASKLVDHGWIAENSNDCRHSVGQKQANPWGLFDLYGNVAEWTMDQYFLEGYQMLHQRANGTILKTEQALLRSKESTPSVLRGGGCLNDAAHCRSAARIVAQDREWKHSDPELPNSPWWYTEPEAQVGFRLVRPLNAPLDRQQREEAWGASYPQLAQDVKDVIRTGRAVRGVVNPSLAKEIESFRQLEKR